jgi:hypothetical protein
VVLQENNGRFNVDIPEGFLEVNPVEMGWKQGALIVKLKIM